MPILTPKVRDLAERSVLCWLATSNADGHPNVSPKEIFCLGETDHLLIADIASPTSVANIAVQPAICVSMVDVFEQKGVKLIGRATLIASDTPGFAGLAQPLIDLAGPDFPIRHVIRMDIEAVRPIIAPSYNLRRDLSDAQRRRSAYRTYGVIPCPDPL